MSIWGQVDRRTKFLEFRDDEFIKYVILFRWWIDHTEVDYEETVHLAKMDRQDEIRGRLATKRCWITVSEKRATG